MKYIQILAFLFLTIQIIAQDTLHYFEVSLSSYWVKRDKIEDHGYVNQNNVKSNLIKSYNKKILQKYDYVVSNTEGLYSIYQIDGDTILNNLKRRPIVLDNSFYIIQDSIGSKKYKLFKFPKASIFDSLTFNKSSVRAKDYGYFISKGLFGDPYFLITNEELLSVEKQGLAKIVGHNNIDELIRNKSFILLRKKKENFKLDFSEIFKRQTDTLYYNRMENHSDNYHLQNSFVCNEKENRLRFISDSKGNKGIIDNSNEVIIKPQYSSIIKLKESDGCLFKVEDNDENTGIINLKNEIVIALKYREIETTKFNNSTHYIVTNHLFEKNQMNPFKGMYNNEGIKILDTIYRRIDITNHYSILSKNDGSKTTKGILGKNMKFETTKGNVMFFPITETIYNVWITNRGPSFTIMKFNVDINGNIYLPPNYLEILIDENILTLSNK